MLTFLAVVILFFSTYMYLPCHELKCFLPLNIFTPPLNNSYGRPSSTLCWTYYHDSIVLLSHVIIYVGVFVSVN